MDFKEEIVQFMTDKVGGITIVAEGSAEIVYADSYFRKKYGDAVVGMDAEEIFVWNDDCPALEIDGDAVEWEYIDTNTKKYFKFNSGLFQKEGKNLNTFSFDFVNNHKYFKSNAFQPSEDRPWVDKMVDYAKTDHRYLECDNENMIENLYKAVDARDLPCMADVESSMLYFCSKVVKYNKVTLTGECADEIFGGYPWFHKEECFKAEIFPWSMDMQPRKMLLNDDIIQKVDLESYARTAYQKTINETPKLYGEDQIEARRRQISYLNLRWFMVTLMDRMDRTSMHCGLEARVPFADHRIVEYLYNVPWELKCLNGVVKGLLRAAGEGILPDEVLYRRKSPYPKTYDPNYEKILSKELLKVMAKKGAPIKELIDAYKLSRFLDSPKDYGKPWYGQLMAGPQMIAYLLQVNYWLEKYQIILDLS